ncbi:hypothetical protein APC04_02295 [Acinetobacter baumannii]|nr:hypothetical protein APC04_02295 [Acinetobacter baumannii]
MVHQVYSSLNIYIYRFLFIVKAVFRINLEDSYQLYVFFYELNTRGGKRTRTIMREEKNRPDLIEKLSIRKDSKLNQPAIKSVTLKLSACSHENGNNN